MVAGTEQVAAVAAVDEGACCRQEDTFIPGVSAIVFDANNNLCIVCAYESDDTEETKAAH